MSEPFDSIRKQDASLGDKLERVYQALSQSGAHAAAHRLAAAAGAAEDLQADGLFRAIDPGRAIAELEDAQGHAARRLGAIRNVLALLPLLLTWIALAIATIEYQGYIQAHKDAIRQPFLLLWQQGFDTHSPFTFAATAGLDFALLSLVVIFTILTQNAEASSSRKVEEIAAALDEATQALAIATARHTLRLSPNAQPEEWVRAVQKVVDQAMRQTEELATKNQQVVDEATRVLQGIRQDTQDLMRGEMSPLVERFRTNLGELQGELSRYHQSASDLVSTVQQLGGAATDLAANAESYTSVAASIDTNLHSLAATQTQYVQQFASAAGGLTQAADSVHVLAAQLGQQINQQIVVNLDAASRHLSDVELRLAQTSLELQRAAVLLQRASVARAGLLGMLFGSSR